MHWWSLLSSQHIWGVPVGMGNPKGEGGWIHPSIHPSTGIQAPVALPLPARGKPSWRSPGSPGPAPPCAPAAVFSSSERAAEGINPDNSTSEMM